MRSVFDFASHDYYYFLVFAVKKRYLSARISGKLRELTQAKKFRPTLSQP
jgi:hypothetical protein